MVTRPDAESFLTRCGMRRCSASGDVSPLISTVATRSIRGLTSPARQRHASIPTARGIDNGGSQERRRTRCDHENLQSDLWSCNHTRVVIHLGEPASAPCRPCVGRAPVWQLQEITRLQAGPHLASRRWSPGLKTRCVFRPGCSFQTCGPPA